MLRCEVTDDGPRSQRPVTRAPVPATPLQWRIDPGHGLWLVRRVADETSVQSGPAGTVGRGQLHAGTARGLPPFQLARRFRDGCTVLSVDGRA